MCRSVQGYKYHIFRLLTHVNSLYVSFFYLLLLPLSTYYQREHSRYYRLQDNRSIRRVFPEW